MLGDLFLWFFYRHISNINDNSKWQLHYQKKVKIQQTKRWRDLLTRSRGGSFLLLIWQTGWLVCWCGFTGWRGSEFRMTWHWCGINGLAWLVAWHGLINFPWKLSEVSLSSAVSRLLLLLVPLDGTRGWRQVYCGDSNSVWLCRFLMAWSGGWMSDQPMARRGWVGWWAAAYEDLLLLVWATCCGCGLLSGLVGDGGVGYDYCNPLICCCW